MLFGCYTANLMPCMKIGDGNVMSIAGDVSVRGLCYFDNMIDEMTALAHLMYMRLVEAGIAGSIFQVFVHSF